MFQLHLQRLPEKIPTLSKAFRNINNCIISKSSQAIKGFIYWAPERSLDNLFYYLVHVWCTYAKRTTARSQLTHWWASGDQGCITALIGGQWERGVLWARSTRTQEKWWVKGVGRVKICVNYEDFCSLFEWHLKTSREETCLWWRC